MRTLFLHVGPAKTGTSAVQFFFSQYSGEEIIYPRIGLWANRSHHNLVFNFYEDYRRPQVQRGDVREWMRQIGDLARTRPGNLIISSEVLLGRDLRPFIKELLSCLSTDDEWNVEVLFTCREHVERASSAYNQRVKDPVVMERLDPDAFLARSARTFCYGTYLQKLRGLGLAVRTVNYHPAPDFVPRFLEHLGLKDSQNAAVGQQNRSLSVKGLIATLSANRVATSREQRAYYSSAFRKMRGMSGASHQIFSPQAIMEAERRFARDKKILAREFAVEIPSAQHCSGLQSEFFISQKELDEITAAVSELGEEGMAIAKAASEFLR